MRRFSLALCAVLASCTAGGTEEVASVEQPRAQAEQPACAERVADQPPGEVADPELPACVERVVETEPIESIALIDGQLVWTTFRHTFIRSSDGQTIRRLPMYAGSELIPGAREVVVCDHKGLLLRAGPNDCELERVDAFDDRRCRVSAHGGDLLFRGADDGLLLLEAGATEPASIAELPVHPIMDAETLVWEHDGTVYARARRGRAMRELAREPLPLRELTIAGGYVYWAMGQKLRRVHRDGGAVETLANQQTIRAGLQVDDARAIWVDGGSWVSLELGDAPAQTGVRFAAASNYDRLALGPEGEVSLAQYHGRAIYVVDPASCPEAFEPHELLRPVTPPTHEQGVYVLASSHDEAAFDVVDLSESEWSEAQELAGVDALVAADLRIPARFHPGTPFVVVGADGRLDAEVSAFRVSERDDVRVELTLACPQQQGNACVKQALGPDAALVFRPDEVPKTLQVSRVEPVGRGLRAKIDASVRTAVLAAVREKPRPNASEIHVTTTRARLPDGGVALVSVSVDGDDDDEWGYPRLTGFGVADASGAIIRWIAALEPPTDTYVFYGVMAVFDLDGDGIDEVVVSRSYAEGSRIELLRPARAYATELIGGDNA